MRESQKELQAMIEEMCDLYEAQHPLNYEDSNWLRSEMYDVYTCFRTKLFSHVFMTILLGITVFLALVNINNALTVPARWIIAIGAIIGIIINWYKHYEETINEDVLYDELDERIQRYRIAKQGYKNYY